MIPTSSANSLDRLFAPASVALIGDFSGRDIASTRVARALAPFVGTVWLVGPGPTRVDGRSRVDSYRELPGVPDLVAVSTGGADFESNFRMAAESGVGGLVVFGTGFGERGLAGARRERRILDIARGNGVRLLGPNCAGFANVADQTFVSMVPALADAFTPGALGIVSQSGGVGAALLTTACVEQLGVGYFVTTGNEADVCLAEALDHVIARPEIRVVIAFAEGIKDGHVLLDAARRAVANQKPILFMKAATTAPGVRAALSHTGATVTADDVLSAVLDQHGIRRVSNIAELVDGARTLLVAPKPVGSRVAVVTVSGGGGIVLADALTCLELTVAPFSAQLQRELADALPRVAEFSNPLDLSATDELRAIPNAFERVLGILARSSDIDCIAPILGPVPESANSLIEIVAAATARSSKPIVTTWLGGAMAELLRVKGLPAFDDPARTARAMAALCGKIGTIHRSQEEPSRIHPIARLTLEFDALALLADHGISVARALAAATADESVAAAKRVGFPVALKLLSHDAPHRSDIGGVRTGLRTAAEVRNAYDAIIDAGAHCRPQLRIDGVIVQEMVDGYLELFCGMNRDEHFGPIVSVGLGGRQIEIVRARALRQAPFSYGQALDAVREVCQGRLASHPRGLTADALAAVADILVKLGDLAVLRSEIVEIDCNPLIVSSTHATVADALIVAAP